MLFVFLEMGSTDNYYYYDIETMQEMLRKENALLKDPLGSVITAVTYF